MSLLFLFFLLILKINNGAYTIETRIIVLDMIVNQHKSIQEVSNLIGVSTSCIRLWLQRDNILSNHERLGYENRGRSPSLTTYDFLLLVYIIDTHPTWYAYEISQSIIMRGGSNLSPQVISKYRRMMGYSKKRTWRIAREASLFQAWLFKSYIGYLQLGVQQLVFLDESSFNARRIGERRWAYSRRSVFFFIVSIYFYTIHSHTKEDGDPLIGIPEIQNIKQLYQV